MYLYLLPDDGRMKDRNMSQEITIKEHIVFGCCVSVHRIATDLVIPLHEPHSHFRYK